MFSIKKILVPTDFSDNASNAYGNAQQLAERYGAKVDFIHVIPVLNYLGESLMQLDMPLNPENDIYPKAQERAGEQIEELMDRHLKPETRGDIIVRIAPKPSKAIAEHAEKGDYDLIVMASKGSHESDLLRGSITKKIIRYSEVPVLSTPEPAFRDIKNIVVPTDGSQTSLKALPMAISIALNHNAVITLFHLLELHGTPTESAPKNPLKSRIENIQDALYNAIDDLLVESVSDIQLQRGDQNESQFIVNEGESSSTINVTTVIERAVSAHYAITEYGNEQADLIVMSTHGRSGLSHLLIGSTAEKVVQHSASPTLTVKPDFVGNA